MGLPWGESVRDCDMIDSLWQAGSSRVNGPEGHSRGHRKSLDYEPSDCRFRWGCVLPAATTATAATTTTAVLAWSGFVDGHGATGDLLVVQPINRLLTGLLVVHFDKGEST